MSGACEAARYPARANALAERRPRSGGSRRGRGACRGESTRLGLKVIVAGAGIAGLTAAWELARSGQDVAILESERRLGGVIVTEEVDGFVVEGGPDGFLASEPELPALAQELGIGNRVIDQVEHGTSLWSRDRFEPLPAGRAAALLGIDATATEVAAGFRSFARGMAEPVAIMAQRLAGSLRLAQGVAGITRNGQRWRLAITGGSAHDADAIVLAVPAYTAGRLLESVGIRGAREVAEVVYATSTTVSLAYRTEQIGAPLEGAGFVVDPNVAPEQTRPPIQIRACTFASQKFSGRAPAGHTLLRVYLGATGDHPSRLAHEQLAAMLGIRGEPQWSRTFHWNRGLPRYRPHHAERIAGIRHRLERLPPLALAGAGYDGAGVSACARSGRAAGRLIAQLAG